MDPVALARDSPGSAGVGETNGDGDWRLEKWFRYSPVVSFAITGVGGMFVVLVRR